MHRLLDFVNSRGISDVPAKPCSTWLHPLVLEWLMRLVAKRSDGADVSILGVIGDPTHCRIILTLKFDAIAKVASIQISSILNT